MPITTAPSTYNCCFSYNYVHAPTVVCHQLLPYSGFYLRGPNFCEICEVLTSSQILILKLLFYLHEPATEHVILARAIPEKHIIIANKSQISVYRYGMCPTTVVPLHVATAKDHSDFVCQGDKPALLR